MMKMTQAVKGCSLTNPRVNRKHLNERLKIHILQFQILTTAFSISVPAMPVVTQRVPPHLNRTIEWLCGEKAFKQICHRADAFFSRGKGQVGVVNYPKHSAIKVRTLYRPEP